MPTKSIIQKALVLFALLTTMTNAHCKWWHENAQRKLGYWTVFPSSALASFMTYEDVASGKLDTVSHSLFDVAGDADIFQIMDSTYTSHDALYLDSKDDVTMSNTFPMYNFSGDSITIDVKIGYKEIQEDADSTFSIILNMFGEHSKIIQTDTISLPLNITWTEVTRSITMPRGLFLEARIEVVRKFIYSMLAFTMPEISSGGKPLERPKWDDDGEKLAKVSPEVIQPLDGLLSSPLMDKKILALGETLHGSQAVSDTIFEVIKQRILHHNCRLVMFETYTEMALYINRYIKNDDRYSIDTISAYLQTIIPSNKLDFLRWLKDYNAAHNNEVTFVGVEAYPMYDQLYDFFEPFNYDFRLDSLCYDLLSYKGNVDEDVVAQRITPQELAIIKHHLGLHFDGSWSDYSKIRNLFMADIVQLACNEYLAENETATLYSHFGHSCYLYEYYTTDYIKSAGYYLKERYKDDYSSVAFAVAEGVHTEFDSKNESWERRNLYAPKGCLEDIMSHSSSDAPIFISMDSFDYGDVCGLRSATTHVDKLHEFILIEPKANMDGIVILKHSRPSSFDYPPLSETYKKRAAHYRSAKTTIEKRLKWK